MPEPTTLACSNQREGQQLSATRAGVSAFGRMCISPHGRVRSHVAQLADLLEYGAGVDCVDASGRTPLMSAAGQVGCLGQQSYPPWASMTSPMGLNDIPQ